MFEGTNLLEFTKEFNSDASCKAYLSEIKSKDGFTCKKCGHTKYYKGKDYHRVCQKCYQKESSTSGTIFHHLRFGLQKAFHIIFEMSTSSKGISSVQISKRYGITQKTAWYFMQKVRKSMESSTKFPMDGIVNVDEFVVGGKEDGKQGRSYDTKKVKAVIAVELTEKRKIKRAYIKQIDSYSAKSLRPIFEDHISKEAKVTTDKWKGYIPIKKEYNITQQLSKKGSNFKELHIVIQTLKSWLRAIPTHISKEHVQKYFDEFCFRLNRSQFKKSIFDKVIHRMIAQEPFTFQMIRCC
ncbi:MAG TPA: IS1595 family transposase [Bacteroidetes bacterium]|nr:IS1595 family transposase [Bacteroidota bacterium]